MTILKWGCSRKGFGVGAVIGVSTYLYSSSGGKGNENECSCAVDTDEPSEQEGWINI